MVLWRHGRTEWNASGRFQGQLDIALDEEGRAQAARAAAMLAALAPVRIVSSDLSRARETAEPLARLTSLDVGIDPALRETYAGDWQGMLTAEIRAARAAEKAAWDTGDVHVRPGGDGESRVEVADRVAAAVRRGLEPVPPGGVLVVVTHGGAARVGIARLIDLPEASWSALGGLANCCWSVLAEIREGGWRIVEHNAGSLPEPVLVQEG